MAGLAVDAHVARGLAHEAIDLAQAQAGAAARHLGGEEGLEGALQRTPVHAAAGIGDGDQHVLPGLERLGHRLGIGLVEIGVGGLDGHLAAFGHGVARVDGEVQDRRLELVLVGEGEPQPAGQHGLERDRLAQGAAQQFGRVGDQPVGVERAGVERLLAREGEQAVGQDGGALRALQGKIARAGDARGGRDVAELGELAADHVQPAHDDGQQIVEVVRHAAGELADRFHLL